MCRIKTAETIFQVHFKGVVDLDTLRNEDFGTWLNAIKPVKDILKI
jgi:hypothetical protein